MLVNSRGAGLAEFAAVAALLDASEGQARVGGGDRVDEQRAGVDARPTASAWSASADQTLAPRPYGVALASATRLVVGRRTR